MAQPVQIVDNQYNMRMVNSVNKPLKCDAGNPSIIACFEILTERRVGFVWIEWIMYVTVMKCRFIYACVAENADNNLEV